MSDEPKGEGNPEASAQSSINPTDKPFIPQPDPGCRMQNRESRSFANEQITQEELNDLNDADEKGEE